MGKIVTGVKQPKHCDYCEVLLVLLYLCVSLYKTADCAKKLLVNCCLVQHSKHHMHA